MSKTVWIFALLCVAAGFALSAFGVVNITSIISQIPQQFAGGFQQVTSNPVQWITDNIAWIAGSMTIVTAVYGGVKSLANQQKNSYETKLQEQRTEVNQLSQEYLDLNQQKTAVSAALEEKTAELNKITNLQDSLAEENKKLTDQLTQVRRDYGDMKAILEEYKKKIIVTPVDVVH